MKSPRSSGPGRAGDGLRGTGVYVPPIPGQPHTWQERFDAFTRGELPAPHAGTEVHAEDLARTVRLLCWSWRMSGRWPPATSTSPIS